MDFIGDESGRNIRALQHILESAAPELAGPRGLSLILPEKLGELERPEYISIVRAKIAAIESLQKRLEEGSLNREDFRAKAKEIIRG